MKREKYIVIIFLLVLCIPAIQQYTNIIQSKPLGGVIEKVAFSKWNLHDWLEGTFQSRTEKYIEQNVGFKSDLVRLNNQIDFTLFKKLNSNLVLGKSNQIFEKRYLVSIAGMDFVGESQIKSKVEKLSFVSRKLKENKVDLIVVVVPSKAGFYKELIPDFYKRKPTNPTNYDCCIKLLHEYGLNVIDFKKYFDSIKDTSRFLLFPEQGVHWSEYGSRIAADSIARYIASIRKTKLNNISWDKIELSSTAEGTDYDLGNLANLIFPLSHPKYAYPKLSFENDSTKIRPRVLAIGDSYYWNIYSSGIPHNIFHQAHFWYYNHDVHADSLTEMHTVNDDNDMKVVENHDVLIILQNESNLDNVGFFFPEAAYAYYKNTVKTIDGYIQQIRNNPEMMKLMKEKAFQKNKTIDEVIEEDARWIRENDLKNLK